MESVFSTAERAGRIHGFRRHAAAASFCRIVLHMTIYRSGSIKPAFDPGHTIPFPFLFSPLYLKKDTKKHRTNCPMFFIYD